MAPKCLVAHSSLKGNQRAVETMLCLEQDSLSKPKHLLYGLNSEFFALVDWLQNACYIAKYMLLLTQGYFAYVNIRNSIRIRNRISDFPFRSAIHYTIAHRKSMPK